MAATGQGSVDVTVVDGDGAGVPEVAVYAVPAGATVPGRGEVAPDGGERRVAKMDQNDRAFVPHILIVETGTLIEFPNSDEILHHVYSFSPARRFQLSLYGGSTHAPLQFDEAGVVTLGCNIHDEMLAYILVVETPHFALTDGDGRASLDGLADGDYSLVAWTPRLRPDRLPPPVRVRVADGRAQTQAIALTEKLYPPHEHSETSLLWSRY